MEKSRNIFFKNKCKREKKKYVIEDTEESKKEESRKVMSFRGFAIKYLSDYLNINVGVLKVPALA